MSEVARQDVSSALDLLLEEIDREIESSKQIASRAVEDQRYEEASAAIERCRILTEFREKAASLRKEWEKLGAERRGSRLSRSSNKTGSSLPRGSRTPEVAYYTPILRVLCEMGGRGRTQEVLDRVGEIMKPVLKEVDYQSLASNANMPRWRKAAQWARHSMVEEGLLVADSPSGVWEITDAGREYLRKHTSEGGGR